MAKEKHPGLNEAILARYENEGPANLAQEFGVTVSAIRQRAARRGLSYTSRPWSGKKKTTNRLPAVHTNGVNEDLVQERAARRNCTAAEIRAARKKAVTESVVSYRGVIPVGADGPRAFGTYCGIRIRFPKQPTLIDAAFQRLIAEKLVKGSKARYDKLDRFPPVARQRQLINEAAKLLHEKGVFIDPDRVFMLHGTINE